MHCSSIQRLTVVFSAESLQKRLWRSIVYAFFEERPKVVCRNNKKGVKSTYLAFSCVKCLKSFFQGTRSDSGSTGAMCNHVPQCWGEDIWNNAKDLKLDPAKEIIQKSRTMKNIKLTEMLARLPGSKETFSLSPPSHEEIWYYENWPPNLLANITSQRDDRSLGVWIDVSLPYCQGLRLTVALQNRTATLLPSWWDDSC